MKRFIAGCLMATAGTLGYAQTSNVTIYGVIDTGVEYLTKVGATGDSVTRMPTLTGTVPSRWGMRGTEDLGGGLSTVFTLESGFGPDAGGLNQGGRFFGRQAFVGLSGSWGALTVGRQYTMLSWASGDADILGPNIYGGGSLDSYIPNAREDNSIAYRGTFSGVTVGGTYSFGRDVVNAGSPSGTNCGGENAADKSACRAWSAMVKYDTPVWGVALAHDHMNGGAGAFAGLTSSAMADTRTVLNGYVKFAQAKVGAGVIRRNNDGSPTPKSDLFYIGASYPVTPALTLDAQIFKLDFKNSPAQAKLFAARGTYAFSKRTSAYLTAGQISNDGGLAISVSSGQGGGNPAANASQTGVMVGVRHFF
jgi:predicted porin